MNEAVTALTRWTRTPLVSVLIGVNDVVQGVPEASYRRNVTLILDEVVALVGADRVVVTARDHHQAG